MSSTITLVGTMALAVGYGNAAVDSLVEVRIAICYQQKKSANFFLAKVVGKIATRRHVAYWFSCPLPIIPNRHSPGE